MKLFNVLDEIKMLVPDVYELALFKLHYRLIFHAGHVKLRGDRYLYNGAPVVRLNHVAGHIVIELTEPVFPEGLLLPEEHGIAPSQLSFGRSIKAFKFRIGNSCKAEFKQILDHIRSVNERHVYRIHSIKKLSMKANRKINTTQ